jgi:hypothetical protein
MRIRCLSHSGRLRGCWILFEWKIYSGTEVPLPVEQQSQRRVLHPFSMILYIARHGDHHRRAGGDR